MAPPILKPTQWWECPSCTKQHVTHDMRVITPMHPCGGLRGLMAPYVRVYNNHGTRLRHEVVEREDYVGQEKGLNSDGEGKVVMAVRTLRPDGSFDCAVFPGRATATASMKEQS